MRNINVKPASLTLAAAFITAGLAGSPAFAASEKEILKACELKVCGLIASKQADGENISCDLTKTWGNKEISEGTLGKTMKWSWGDAKCSTKITLDRKAMVTALTADKGEAGISSTPVTCHIGSGDAKDALTFTLAPKLSFEKGQAVKVNLGLDNIKGPFMQRMALKTAALIDKTKLFQSPMLKEINKFIKRCPSQVK